MQVEAVVLDIDGVLVDVSNSYRRAIVTAVEVVYGETIPKAGVQSFKNAGGFNNDWVVTDAVALYVLAKDGGLEADVEAFTDDIEAAGGGREGAQTVLRNRLSEETVEGILERFDPDRLRTVFQQLYLGPTGYRELEGGEPDLYQDGSSEALDLPADGFMANEPILATSETLETLSAAYDLGVVTGRPRAEARLALDRVGLEIPDDRLFAMEDGPGKPHPDNLITVAEQCDSSALAFAGDTLDDIRTAKNAAQEDSERSYFGIGVLTGGLTGEAGRAAFRNVGADDVIESINELPGALESL